MKYNMLESMFDERVRIVAKNANLKTMMGGGGERWRHEQKEVLNKRNVPHAATVTSKCGKYYEVGE